MAQITRPDVNTQGGSARIGLNIDSGQAGLGEAVSSFGKRAAQTNIASITSQLASQLDASGQKMFEDSKHAHQSALLLKKTSEATEMFLTGKDQRYSSTEDENGNPLFESLPKDIDALGNSVIERVAGTIIDPEVASKFRNQFGSYVLNQKVSAYSEARRQQVDYGKNNLDKGLGKLVEHSLKDGPQNTKDYELQGLNAIRESVVGGIIDREDGERLATEFSMTIREAGLQSLIKKDKGVAQQVLSASADKLGITPERKTELEAQLKATIDSDQVQTLKAKQRGDIDKVNIENAVVEQAEARIQADAIREDELLSLREHMSPTKFSALKKTFLKAAQKREVELHQTQQLAEKIATGQDITDVTNKQIDGYHDYLVEQASDVTKGPVSLQEQAKLAAGIPRAVNRYAKKLEYATKFGDTQTAADSLAAYSYIKDRNKPTLDGAGFDKEATMIMEHTQLLVEKAGLTPTVALKQAREAVSNQDPALREYRSAQFREFKQFKVDKIEETAATALGAETFLFGKNYISQEATATFKQLTEEAYSRLGDKNSAIAFATAQMSRTYGESEVGGERTYMLNPPEKVYPQYTSEQLRSALQSDVVPILPPGTDPESIGISSIDATSNSWAVTYKADIDGQEVEMPLINPNTGAVVRWSPTVKKAAAVVDVQGEANDAQVDAQVDVQESPIVKEISKLTSKASSEVLDAFAGSEETLAKYGIDSPKRLKMFLAQTAHESGNFTAMVENISDSRAESKYGRGTRVGKILGNTEIGDGAAYKGRGIIQLTGRYNYRKIGEMIGQDLENNPELAADPKLAVEIAAAFWKSKGLNQAADDGDVKLATKMINGGYTGLSQRKENYRKLRL